jgi:hypothetical protein
MRSFRGIILLGFACQAESRIAAHHSHRPPKISDRDYKFPKFDEFHKHGLSKSPFIGEKSPTHFAANSKSDLGIIRGLKHAYSWSKADYQKALSTINGNLIAIQAQPTKKSHDGRTCKRGTDSEDLLMNACIMSQMWNFKVIVQDVLKCKDKDWNPIPSPKGCWTSDANVAFTQCCHHKLDPKSCEADLYPLEKMLKDKLKPAYKRCTGWHYRDGCSGSPKKCAVKNGKSDPKQCARAAQYGLYSILDLKYKYMMTAAKTGGVKAQCDMDQDDDWFGTGDHHWGHYVG